MKIRKFNEGFTTKDVFNDVEELDWKIIRDSLIDVFEDFNVNVVLYFYSTKKDSELNDAIYYHKYQKSSNINGFDPLNIDINSLKEENRSRSYLDRFPNGSKLWGIQFCIKLKDDFYKTEQIKSPDNLTNISNYFLKCSELTNQIDVTVKRIVDYYENYRVAFKHRFDISGSSANINDWGYSDSGMKNGGYILDLQIFDREIRKIMENEYRWNELNWIN